MLKGKKLNSHYIEILLKHPLSEIGTISMFAFKLNNGDALFTIPHHHWSLFKSELNKAQLPWPSSFQYSPFKEELKSIMEITADQLQTMHHQSVRKAE